WGVGCLAGLAIGLSAYFQGKCAACACDAMGETGKGFGNYLAVLGIVETVALFVMVFTLIVLGKLAGA
ncbi:MAG: V-type ATP synthase subunit K, partial [Candidatus Omnitrophota bacterium]